MRGMREIDRFIQEMNLNFGYFGQVAKNRQKDNKLILEKLNEFLENNPDIRFGQALYILGILKQDENGNTVDIFNDEPSAILKRIKS